MQVGTEKGVACLDKAYELLTIKKLDGSRFAPGNTSVEIEFSGDMKNRMVGLYTSSYRGKNGARSVESNIFPGSLSHPLFLVRHMAKITNLAQL